MTRPAVPSEVPDASHSGENQLLAALPATSRDALLPHLERVSCSLKDIISLPPQRADQPRPLPLLGSLLPAGGR